MISWNSPTRNPHLPRLHPPSLPPNPHLPHAAHVEVRPSRERPGCASPADILPTSDVARAFGTHPIAICASAAALFANGLATMTDERLSHRIITTLSKPLLSSLLHHLDASWIPLSDKPERAAWPFRLLSSASSGCRETRSCPLRNSLRALHLHGGLASSHIAVRLPRLVK